jgi:CheY-like chemotaxis protein
MRVRSSIAVARILVIDDNEDLCAAMQGVLEAAGHAAAYELDGERGIERLRVESFDVVVTDIFMPGREGLETIKLLRQEFPAVKIIAISGGGDLGIEGQYLQIAGHLGASRTLRKPFGSDALLSAIRELVSAS